MTNETIAAIATAPGRSAVAVIRVSGPGAKTILARIFRAGAPLPEMTPRMMRHGFILGRDGLPIDEVLAVFMPGPRSFTGEDCLEIHGHGGPAVARSLLEEVLAAGAGLAEPGEFTKRAFLNGKLDLTQAEAVAELVSASGRGAARLAMAALCGHLRALVASMRVRLEELRAQICLAVDFPEDEAEFAGFETFGQGVSEVLNEIVKLLAESDRARPLREGALAVLAGPVNAGKSSLLNALIGRDRAIVSEAAGTTRDYLEEGLDLDGLAVRLADTAGLRDDAGGIERLGMQKSLSLMDQADLVVLVLDRAAGPSPDEETRIFEAAGRRGPARTLVAANKSDLAACVTSPVGKLLELGFEVALVSARTGDGLDALGSRMRARILSDTPGETLEDAAAPNQRQARALEKARDELLALRDDARAGLPPDCLGVRLDTACAWLSEITGEITTEAVLQDVFSRFCIGK